MFVRMQHYRIHGKISPLLLKDGKTLAKHLMVNLCCVILLQGQDLAGSNGVAFKWCAFLMRSGSMFAWATAQNEQTSFGSFPASWICQNQVQQVAKLSFHSQQQLHGFVGDGGRHHPMKLQQHQDVECKSVWFLQTCWKIRCQKYSQEQKGQWTQVRLKMQHQLDWRGHHATS